MENQNFTGKRNELPNFGSNQMFPLQGQFTTMPPQSLQIVPHPTQPGTFVIAQQNQYVAVAAPVPVPSPYDQHFQSLPIGNQSQSYQPLNFQQQSIQPQSRWDDHPSTSHLQQSRSNDRRAVSRHSRRSRSSGKARDHSYNWEFLLSHEFIKQKSLVSFCFSERTDYHRRNRVSLKTFG